MRCSYGHYKDRSPGQLGPARRRLGIPADRPGVLLISQYLARYAWLGYSQPVCGYYPQYTSTAGLVPACRGGRADSERCPNNLIALHPQHYEILHGPIGETVANWLSFGLIAG